MLARSYTSVLTLLLLLLSAKTSYSQCAGGAYWVNGPNAGGSLRDTGVIFLIDTVYVHTSPPTFGSFAAGRPLYGSNTVNWNGADYQSIRLARGGGNGAVTSFKLKIAADSFQIHLVVSDVRGDFFNWETQRIMGYLNGVKVPATFKDLTIGASQSGDDLIGGSGTTSTVQSRARIFFHGPVDSISVRSVSQSDFVVMDLMARCDVILANRPPSRQNALSSPIQADMKLIGNPITRQVRLHYRGGLQSVLVMDLQGRILYRQILQTGLSGEKTIPADGWSSGLYQLIATDQKGKQYITQILKR